MSSQGEEQSQENHREGEFQGWGTMAISSTVFQL